MTTAVCVARVSTPQQNIDTQVHEMNSYCDNKGYDVVHTMYISVSAYRDMPRELLHFVDKLNSFITGDNRYSYVDASHEMKTIYEQVLSGNNIVFVFSDVDRMSRNVCAGINFVESIMSMNGRVEFVREPILDCRTPEGRNMLRIKLSQAELESDKIGLRVKARFALKRFHNEHIGRTSYGTKIDSTTKRLVENPEEKFIIGIITVMNGNYTVEDVLTCIYQYHLAYRPAFVEPGYGIYVDGVVLERSALFTATATQMAEILNGFNVRKRGRSWNSKMIKAMCKKFAVPVVYTMPVVDIPVMDTDDTSLNYDDQTCDNALGGEQDSREDVSGEYSPPEEEHNSSEEEYNSSEEEYNSSEEEYNSSEEEYNSSETDDSEPIVVSEASSFNSFMSVD